MNVVNRESVTTLALRADPMRAEDVLRLALDTFRQRAALSSSFGAEDMVLIDMLLKIDPKARIFTLDTGRLPQETYNVIDATRQKYGAKHRSDVPAARRSAKHGGRAWHEPLLPFGRTPEAVLRCSQDGAVAPRVVGSRCVGSRASGASNR
jgi:3'-phosphoadenosine 5'-phosphosulfate sulfotransferase (PAPS reductase)/FAD synthetase